MLPYSYSPDHDEPFGMRGLICNRQSFLLFLGWWYNAKYSCCMQSQLSFTLGQKIKTSFGGCFPRICWQKFFSIQGYFSGIRPYASDFLGWLAPGKTPEELRQHLSGRVRNHFVAWLDKDQALSWRKLDGFDYQYHLRVYTDGEIRGHYGIPRRAGPMDHSAKWGKTQKVF